MIDVEAYALQFPAGATFWLTAANLGAASDEEFDAAVRPVVECGGGASFRRDRSAHRELLRNASVRHREVQALRVRWRHR